MLLRRTLPFLALVAAASAHADLFSYVTWDTSTDTGTSVHGTIPSDQGLVGVTLTGAYDSVTNNSSDSDDFNPVGTYTGGIVGNKPDTGAFVKVSGTPEFALAFDRPITNLALDLWSVGNGNQPVSYTFDHDFSLVAGGANSKYGGSALVKSGMSVTGNEGNGVLLFGGPLSTLGFTIGGSEFYHGFTLGLAHTQAVPEPAPVLALAGGALALLRRRRRA